MSWRISAKGIQAINTDMSRRYTECLYVCNDVCLVSKHLIICFRMSCIYTSKV